MPTGTAIAPNGDVYVADGYGSQFIIQYDHKGNYIRHFGGAGKGKDNLFMHCHDVCVDHSKDLYIRQWNARSSIPIKLERVDSDQT